MLSDLTKYHGVGDTPKSNDRRPIDPVSIKDVCETPMVNGAKAGDFAAPGGGSGHIIVTQWQLDNFDKNEGFNQALDEDFRAIREIYKTVLPYSLNIFKKYIKSVISIYCAMLMVRQKLASYNQTHDTIPFLHNALVSTPSNVSEIGVVAATKIKFLEEDDIAVTLANYTFLANRVKSLVIPQATKQFLDWLFANQFTDSNLIAPQFYINELSNIPLYGAVSNDLVVVQNWSLQDGSLQDIVRSVEDVITLGSMINADLHKTGLMTSMDVPELANSIKDKDYEYFNILINAVSPDAPATIYAKQNPFKEDYGRVDVIGSIDDSHIQAAALGLLRRWGHGLVVEIVSQGIYIPSTVGGCAPFNRVTGIGNSVAKSGMPVQEESFYIQFSGNYQNLISSNRVAANASQTYAATKDVRCPSGLTFTQATLNGTGLANFNVSGTLYVNIAYAPGRYYLRLKLVKGGTNKLVITDYVNNTEYDLGNLGATNVPFEATIVKTWADGSESIEVKGTMETYTTTTAAEITALAEIFGDNGVFAWLDVGASFTFSESTVSYTLEASNPVLLALFVEQIDYHIPMQYELAFNVKDGGTSKVRMGVGYIQLKESYTPYILNKYDCEAFLRFALLGMFTSGGKVSYARPRNEQAKRNDTRRRNDRRHDKRSKDEDEK